MQKYKKPTFTYAQLGTNPCSFTVPVNELAFKDQYKREPDGTLLPLTLPVEATPYTKVYVSSDRRLIIAKLSPAAKELYLWIMFEVDSGKDALWINKDRYMIENSTSLNTYKKALTELLRYALIVKTIIKDVYWINPDFFFRGDRIAKYPNKIV